MLIFIHFLVLLSMTIVNCKILILESGISPIDENDMALIFYLKIHNAGNTSAYIKLSMIRCTESGTITENVPHIDLLGYSGTVEPHVENNLTLIYPNVILQNRIGVCYIEMLYKVGDFKGHLEKNIKFNTRKLNAMTSCPTYDLDSINNCRPFDCVVKYSSVRNFYNQITQICEVPTSCPIGTIYLPDRNDCIKSTDVTIYELKVLDNGNIDQIDKTVGLSNFECHHGTLDSEHGDCYCNEGWTTSPCPASSYNPSLFIYHMCNIEISANNEEDNEKFIIIVIAIVIFAFAILAKMLIAICILNWCCTWIRRRRYKKSKSKYTTDPEIKSATDLSSTEITELSTQNEFGYKSKGSSGDTSESKTSTKLTPLK